ncbi:Transient-receptor-potential-like protein [Taenia solium]|eukprot:TsM_000601000 transcript=TsM_000601000 gene=TsM_000601000
MDSDVHNPEHEWDEEEREEPSRCGRKFASAVIAITCGLMKGIVATHLHFEVDTAGRQSGLECTLLALSRSVAAHPFIFDLGSCCADLETAGPSQIIRHFGPSAVLTELQVLATLKYKANIATFCDPIKLSFGILFGETQINQHRPLTKDAEGKMVDLKSPQVTVTVGEMLLMIYHFMAIIVLINILIAMMSTSFQIIQAT